jgi:hypothetical protein
MTPFSSTECRIWTHARKAAMGALARLQNKSGAERREMGSVSVATSEKMNSLRHES